MLGFGLGFRLGFEVGFGLGFGLWFELGLGLGLGYRQVFNNKICKLSRSKQNDVIKCCKMMSSNRYLDLGLDLDDV